MKLESPAGQCGSVGKAAASTESDLFFESPSGFSLKNDRFAGLNFILFVLLGFDDLVFCKRWVSFKEIYDCLALLSEISFAL